MKQKKNILDLGLSEEELRKINEEEQERIRIHNERKKAIRMLDRFPGSLEEYILMKKDNGKLLEGDLILPMDTGLPDKRVNYNDSVSELYDLIQDGCIALIRFDSSTFYGLPVKIKRIGHPYGR